MNASSASGTWSLRLLETAANPPRRAAQEEAERRLARLGEDREDLALALQWLSQAIEGIPATPERLPATSTLRGYVRDMGDVRDAAARALEALAAPDAAALLVEGAPLVRYLESLYDSCETMLDALERISSGLRRGDPVWAVFPLKDVERSFAHFEQLTGPIHEDVRRLQAASRGAAAEALLALDHRLEELFWAASWLHLSLTRRFGG